MSWSQLANANLADGWGALAVSLLGVEEVDTEPSEVIGRIILLSFATSESLLKGIRWAGWGVAV